MSVRPPSRSPWQRFYEYVLGVRRRRAAGHRLGAPVISVGNLHWGGGGKTPLTRSIAVHLRDTGQRVTILSRGYGRASRGPLVVSRGEGTEVPVDMSGDEAALLASEPGIQLVVAERRIEGGRLAEASFDTDVFLLDDGFSHVDLARNIDLLVFPAADPWAGSRLLPSGRLREPLSFAQQADAVVLTGAADDGLDPEATTSLDELRSGLARHGYRGPTFASISQASLDAARPPKNVLLVSGVARPQSVRHTADRLASAHQFRIGSELRFRDHESYSAERLAQIRNEAARADADTVMVTEKDRVKLDGRLDLPAATQLAAIELHARPSSDFFAWLDQRLSAI